MNQKLLQSLSRVAETRFKIFCEEMRLEKITLLRLGWLIAAGFVSLQLAMLSVLFLGIALTEGEDRIWFLGIVGGASVVVFTVSVILAVRLLSKRRPPFAMTANEFKKDKACLESVLKS